MKLALILFGVLIGLVLGVAVGPNVRAFWQERELRTANEALSAVEDLLADLVALPEHRATLLNERVDLAGELARYASYEALSSEAAAPEQLERLFAIEHELVELDERERWLRAERERLTALEQRLEAHVDGSSAIPETEWPAILVLLDAAPRANSSRPNDKALRRLFESLGGA